MVKKEEIKWDRNNIFYWWKWWEIIHEDKINLRIQHKNIIKDIILPSARSDTVIIKELNESISSPTKKDQNSPVNNATLEEFLKNPQENILIKYQEQLNKWEWLEWEKILQENWINTTDQAIVNKKKNALYRYIKKYREIFPDTLSEEQKLFLIDFSPRILLQARAWSWKTTTLVQKTHFLLNECWFKKEDIIFLAFNKSAVRDVNDRFTGQRLENAMTFHSLAGRIGSLDYEDEEIHIQDEKDQQNVDLTLNNAVRHVIQDLFQKEGIKKLVYQIFRTDKSGEESSAEYEEFINNKWLSSKEYYEIVRWLNYQTLLGENITVKSKAEKWIADFLFEHGIEYSYEWTEQYWNKQKNIRWYSPDFRLDNFPVKPDFLGKIFPKKVWIEFWWINEFDLDKKINPDWNTTWEKYREEMEWKRQYWKEKYDNRLIEFSINDIDYSNHLGARELFEKKIKETLEKNWIICKKLPEEELIKRVVENFKTKIEKMVEQFINKCKQRKWSPEEVSKKILTNELFHEWRVGMFYSFAQQCYSLYQEKLKKTWKKDFNDILIDATKKIHKEKWDIEISISKKFWLKTNLGTIKYLMIDEYQDFSQLYYELISSIIEYNPNIRIVCVGDDWQLINSFSGSEERFYKKFEELFVWGKRLWLLKTWRCPHEIVNISNNLMHGLGEWTICGKNHHGSMQWKYIWDIFIECRKEEIEEYRKDSIYFTDKDRKELKKARYLKYCCEIILEWKKQDKKTTFLIMSPFNTTPFKKIELIDAYVMLLERQYGEQNIKKEEIEKKLDKDITMQTVHKSKWAEADICILLQVWKNEDKGNTKFPFLHPDYPFERIFWNTPLSILEEQRRLFYVALTRTKQNLYFISESEFTKLPENFLISSFNEGYNDYANKAWKF